MVQQMKPFSSPLLVILLLSITSVTFIIFIHRDLNLVRNVHIIETTDISFYQNLDEVQIPNGDAIHTPGCKIQNFHPFDQSIVNLLDKSVKFNCSKLPSLVVIKNTKILQVDFTVLGEYGGHLDYCLYIPIFRDGLGYSDDAYIFGESEQFFDFITVRHEFIKLECFNFYKKIYENFHAFINIKPHVEKRCHFITNSNSFTNTTVDKLSVALIVVDSVSRLNFIRYCPKTRSYLLNDMKGIELKGYNKVGDNTFHNLVPLLHNTYVSELKWSIKEPFDKFKLIWKEYAMKGYRTVLAEEDPEVSIFNYLKSGFYYTPVDYYIRPLYNAFINSTLSTKSDYECFGNKLNTEVILDYAYDFLKTFPDQLYFSLFLMSSLTHDHLDLVRHGDKHYVHFLKKVNQENLLNKSILFFFSDHAIRFGKFRASYVGRLEERLPMFYIVFPPWFHKKYPLIVKTVRDNSRKLTTPFDIYATLKDLLHFTGIQRKNVTTSKRGISLFDEIPEERTCQDASILPHWCTCQEMSQLSNDDIIVKKLATFIVEEINNLTESNRDVCIKLKLKSIMEAWKSTSNDKILKYKHLAGSGDDENVKFKRKGVVSIQDFTISLMTSPGNAQFESTIRYDRRTRQMILTGDVSRINRYGNQSHCVNDYIQRKYCYCKDMIKN